MFGRLGIFSVLCLLSQLLFAQKAEISSGFVEDSIGLGEELHYWLSVSYPIEEEYILPDTNYNFKPYEFLDKFYSETQVKNGIAFDSAVYSLQTFEIEQVQYLSLPVFKIENGDSISVKSPLDSVYFRELAPVVTDTTSLKANVQYREVLKQFNYPLWGIILTALGIIVLIVFLAFGKKIRRKLLIRRMRREYGIFSTKFSEYIQRLKNNPSSELVEEATGYWKGYLEKIEAEPFRKLTTTEILKYNYTAELKDSLKAIDRCIYGKEITEDIYKHAQVLEDFSDHRYSLKIDALQDGK